VELNILTRPRSWEKIHTNCPKYVALESFINMCFEKKMLNYKVVVNIGLAHGRRLGQSLAC